MPKCDLFHPDNVLALIQLECLDGMRMMFEILFNWKRKEKQNKEDKFEQKFQLSQRISCSICLENKAEQTSQKQWPWYNQTRSYE